MWVKQLRLLNNPIWIWIGSSKSEYKDVRVEEHPNQLHIDFNYMQMQFVL